MVSVALRVVVVVYTPGEYIIGGFVSPRDFCFVSVVVSVTSQEETKRRNVIEHAVHGFFWFTAVLLCAGAEQSTSRRDKKTERCTRVFYYVSDR